MHVTIHTAAVPDGKTNISNDALDLVRGNFNPSKLPQVDRIKALAAALISEMEPVQALRMDGAREASVAITQIQGACMFAVAAVTAKG
jgi:CHASE3 domain sensor protein